MVAVEALLLLHVQTAMESDLVPPAAHADDAGAHFANWPEFSNAASSVFTASF